MRHVPNYRPLSGEARRYLEDADLIVEQVMDGHVAASSSEVKRSGKVLPFPMITGGFLWPYGGAPNIHNRTYSGSATPPYDAEIGDSYLDREILAGRSVEESVRIYADLNVSRLRNPTRLMELVLDRQRARDIATGFSVADYIHGMFRIRPAFLTPYHPELDVSVMLCSQLFAKLDVAADVVERMQQRLPAAPFPQSEAPIHPAVASHFKLEYAAPARRYLFASEGRFSFEEFCRRYMRFEWNGDLAIALDKMWKGDPEKAIETLRSAAAKSPRSSMALRAIATLYHRAGNDVEAVASATTALERDPLDYEAASLLGHLHIQAGNTEKALEVLSIGNAINPRDPHINARLQLVLRNLSERSRGR